MPHVSTPQFFSLVAQGPACRKEINTSAPPQSVPPSSLTPDQRRGRRLVPGERARRRDGKPMTDYGIAARLVLLPL